jgi:hypothetical protein
MVMEICGCVVFFLGLVGDRHEAQVIGMLMSIYGAVLQLPKKGQ